MRSGRKGRHHDGTQLWQQLTATAAHSDNSSLLQQLNIGAGNDKKMVAKRSHRMAEKGELALAAPSNNGKINSRNNPRERPEP
jgi:hypothetical protein